MRKTVLLIIGISIITLIGCVAKSDTANPYDNTEIPHSLTTKDNVNDQSIDQTSSKDAADTVKDFYNAVLEGDREKASYILSYFARRYDERLFSEIKDAVSRANGVHNINFSVVAPEEIQDGYRGMLDEQLEDWHLVLEDNHHEEYFLWFLEEKNNEYFIIEGEELPLEHFLKVVDGEEVDLEIDEGRKEILQQRREKEEKRANLIDEFIVMTDSLPSEWKGYFIEESQVFEMNNLEVIPDSLEVGSGNAKVKLKATARLYPDHSTPVVDGWLPLIDSEMKLEGHLTEWYINDEVDSRGIYFDVKEYTIPNDYQDFKIRDLRTSLKLESMTLEGRIWGTPLDNIPNDLEKTLFLKPKN